MTSLLELILAGRGLTSKQARQDFLKPDYAKSKHDPFLLPDMAAAVERLVQARQKQEKVTIYGDYDIDGLTATTLLLDGLKSFGFESIDTFIPDRFREGYGLTVDAVERIAAAGANLIITVDCGSLSHKEIERAGQLGVDVIVTDHHNVAAVQPPAVAVINPKRLLADHPEAYDNFLLIAEPVSSHLYPFLDLAGVGVAFKLVQALQAKLDGLVDGHEKWLLDLVALGTVCDVVTLADENRANVFWGLEVMKKTRRPGLRALMAVSRVEPEKLNARSLGFGLGPRLNAAGRLETAQLSLDLLTATKPSAALQLAQTLDEMNQARRAEQDEIFKSACQQAEQLASDPVLIVSHPDWSHGIIGIVAAKLLERYHKPTFVLQELPDGSAKGSARSFGDFSAADAIKATQDLIIKGGGHKLAAGVTLEAKNIAAWRQAVNDYYKTLQLEAQLRFLEPQADASLGDLEIYSVEEIEQLKCLEPFGNGNLSPVVEISPLTVTERRTMGADDQHVKYSFQDLKGNRVSLVAFGAADKFQDGIGEAVRVWAEPDVNEWRGLKKAEGRLLKMELVD